MTRNYSILPLLGSLLLLAACSSDPVADDRQRLPLTLVPSTSTYEDVLPEEKPEDMQHSETRSGLATRADYEHLPAGYMPYAVQYATAPKNSTIGIWMTPDNTTSTGNLIYKSGSDWKSTVEVEGDKTYYIYGFMPRTGTETASISSLNGTGSADYANGAVITLADYPTVTANDLCAIVGLRKGATASEDITALTADVPLGSFSFAATAGDNTAFLLLKHLLTGLRFSMKIGTGYHGLRDINVTKVELQGLSCPTTGKLTVRLTANATGTDPLPSGSIDDPTSAIYFDTDGKDTGDIWATLYEADPGDPTDLGLRLDETTPTDYLGCFASPLCTKFNLRTTYDVYDKVATAAHPEGNLVRKGCVAVNTIDFKSLFSPYESLVIRSGERYTVNLTVEPTYLYVLSDPDLDNPTIILTE
ncbi:MAG: hypothetical protein IJ142_05285 [Bacteroidaceae bacterium]|nr:hypothetical protein [Bacteroidaceae bacterium]